MPIRKDDFSAALSKPTPELNATPAMIDDYLRDISPTGIIASNGPNNNNFNSTIGAPGNGSTSNHREIMNKTVNLQKDKNAPFSMADQHSKGVPIARPRGPNIHSDSVTGNYLP